MTEHVRRGVDDDPVVTDDDVQRMLNVVRFLRDPGTPAVWVLSGAVLVGFAAIALGWRAAARTLAVPLQTPALVSGGLGGMAIVLVACIVLTIHLSRRDSAREENEIDRLIDSAYELLRVAPELRAQVALRTGRAAPPPPPAKRTVKKPSKAVAKKAAARR